MKDNIDLMRCKNCANYRGGYCLNQIKKEGVITGNKEYEKMPREGRCSMFQEMIGTNCDHVKEAYYTIIDILKEYCDLEEKYYPIISLWIIGTYAHKEFNTYPYLFINAMRGSGKSRLLRLISVLSFNGDLIGSLTEAVLFRNAQKYALCIDEFEGVGGKDKSALRELLNSGYKKGLNVKRTIKKRTQEGESYETEEYSVYTPIAMANIWGMEEVLSDRCITLILEKSHKKKITQLIEDYEENFAIKKVKELLLNRQKDLQEEIKKRNLTKKWNDYVKNNYTNTLNTYTTQTTETTLFNKIKETGLDGRNLELFFSLFLIAEIVDQETLNIIFEIAKNITKEKRKEELTESKDVLLINFLAELGKRGDLVYRDFVSVARLTNEFREQIGAETDDGYINSRWVGRALKRLNLIIDKRRVARGVEITLNLDKAIQKSPLFHVD